MSQKKIKVNLNTENPLKTILKNGFIPVVKRSKIGFKNTDVSSIFENNENSIKEGCRCFIGGINGYCENHWQDSNIYIGFVKKDTPVYSLTEKKKYITAQEKFNQNLFTYSLYYSNRDYDLEEFDYDTLSFVDAKEISNVLVIEPKDFKHLVKYSNDEVLKILTLEEIFKINFYNKQVPMDFFKCVNLDSLTFNDLEHYLFYRYDSFLFKNILDSYFKYNCEKEYLIKINLKKYLDDKEEFFDWIDAYKDSFFKDYKSIKDFSCTFSENYYAIQFKKNVRSFLSKTRREREIINYSISISENTFKFSSIIKNKDFYDEFKVLNEKEIFCKDSLECLFVFLEIFEKYKQTFYEYYNIYEPVWIERIKNLKNIYDTLKSMNILFNFNNDLSKLTIVINEEISLEYDFELKDFIVTIKEEQETYYYNIDNIPEEFEIEKFLILDFLDVINIEFELSI